MWDSGKKTEKRDLGYLSTLRQRNTMRDISPTDKKISLEYGRGPTDRSTLENGARTKEKDMEPTMTVMESSITRASGGMIKRTERENKFTKTDVLMKESIKIISNMVKGIIFTLKYSITKETLRRILLQGSELSLTRRATNISGH